MPITVKAIPQRGFWRCGVFFSPQPTFFPDGRFTDEQLARLMAEPRLVVTVEGAAAGGSQPTADPEPRDDEGAAEKGAVEPAEDWTPREPGRCQHIRDNGERCKLVALEGSEFCRVHQPGEDGE